MPNVTEEVRQRNTNREHENPLLSAALARAAEGWAVHPLWGIVTKGGVRQCECSAGTQCDKPGKHGRLTGWQDAATQDPKQLQVWWMLYPRANIGAHTGNKSGRNILDVDPHHGGEISIDLLEAEHGSLPDTQETITGGGGRHVGFAYDGPLKNSVSELGPGLDIRSDGGNLVLPGSMHVSGRIYEYEVTHGPDDVALAPLPSWLRAKLSAQPNGNHKPSAEGEPIHDGFRNDTLFKLACSMRNRGCSRATILSTLRAENEARCQPPLADREVEKIANSSSKYAPGNSGPTTSRAGTAEATGETDHEGTAYPYEPHWPTLANEALHGLAGDIVNTIDPYTEADKVAGLLNVLVAFGNCLNAAPHARVQHDNHPARIFATQVGDTSKGRKGTGWSTPRYLLSLCDPDWVKTRVKSGLSSGEGLIFNVRDPQYAKVPRKEKGKKFTGEYDEICVDEGEKDKRLLVVESEFASVLTVANREGSTLSEILRQAWDNGTLSPMTKNNRIAATGAHISIIGHITRQELLARLDDTSKANGFANRFLWALVKRSKELPEGKAVPDELLNPLVARLIDVLTFARTVTAEITRDAGAKALWQEVYHDLSEGKPGLVGAVLSRAEAQVLRLSVIYALLNKSAVVRVEHLQAALAVWEYCERSAVLIFGERLGDPTADRILEALRNAGATGMSEYEIHGLFGRHKSANERTRAVNLLLSLGLIEVTKDESTGGRPATRYVAT